MELKFMEPQARFVMSNLFKRDYNTFTDGARRMVNWAILIGDVAVAYILLQILF